MSRRLASLSIINTSSGCAEMNDAVSKESHGLIYDSLKRHDVEG